MTCKEAEKKQFYDRRAMQAWEDYQATGLHIPLGAFSTWVDSLATDNPQPKPKVQRLRKQQ